MIFSSLLQAYTAADNNETVANIRHQRKFLPGTAIARVLNPYCRTSSSIVPPFGRTVSRWEGGGADSPALVKLRDSWVLCVRMPGVHTAAIALAVSLQHLLSYLRIIGSNLSRNMFKPFVLNTEIRVGHGPCLT